MELKEKLLAIKEEAARLFEEENADIEALRIRYLGKKGELTSVLRGMGAVAPEERPVVGAIVNEVREFIENKIVELREKRAKEEFTRRLASEKLDVTMPAVMPPVGGRHPLSKVKLEMKIYSSAWALRLQRGLRLSTITTISKRLTCRQVILRATHRTHSI